MNTNEVIDGLMAFDNALQKQRKIRELRRSIFECGLSCGNCEHWMKKSACPREHNVNGWQRGPSMNDPKCSKFQESSSTIRNREEMQAKLDDLLETTNPRER